MLVSLHVHFTSSLALAVPARVSYRHHNFHGFLFYTYRRSFFTLTYLAKLVQYLKAIPSIPFTLRVSYTLTDRPDEPCRALAQRTSQLTMHFGQDTTNKYKKQPPANLFGFWRFQLQACMALSFQALKGFGLTWTPYMHILLVSMLLNCVD